MCALNCIPAGDSRTSVMLKLLDHSPSVAIPNNGGLVHAAAQQKVRRPVPFEGEDRSFVHVERILQLPCTVQHPHTL